MGLSHSPKVISDGLVLYLDATNPRSYSGTGSTWTDLSAYGYNSTLVSSPTYINNKYGQLAFNGSTQYATVPYTSTLWNAQTFTLSVWAKKIGTGNAGVSGIMISKDTNYIEHSYNGKTLASFRNSANTQFLVSGNTAASYNEWRHYAVTYDGTQGVLYENGAATGSTTLAMSVKSTTNPLNIGRWDETSYNFNGCISGAMVYNRALSADEVLQNYNATKYKYILQENIVRNGLALHYDMSDYRSAPFTGTSITDLSGIGNTGTLTNGPTYSSVAGGSLSFDGTNDYIDLPSNFFKHDLGTPFTITIWFKTTTTGVIFGQQNTSVPSPTISTGFVPAIYVDTNGKLRTSCFWGGSQGNQSVTLASVNDNIWHNVTVTFESTSHKSYLDGILFDTITKNQSGYSSTYYYFIGGGRNESWASVGNIFFSGNVSNFIFYNRALTAEEVLQNYNATKTRFGIS